MGKKIIYIEPDTMLDIRICNGDEGAFASAWRNEFMPRSVLIRVRDEHSIAFSDPQTDQWDWNFKQQRLGELQQKIAELQAQIDRLKVENAESWVDADKYDNQSHIIEQLQAQVNDMEQALEQVRVFATSHIHLEYGTVFVKVRRNMFLAAIKGEGEEYRAVSKQEEDEIFKKIFERHELEIHTAGSLKSKEDE